MLPKKTMQELDEQYKDCPVQINTYEIEGVKYKVISHYIGNRDIDDVMRDYAYNKIVNEMLNRVPKSA